MSTVDSTAQEMQADDEMVTDMVHEGIGTDLVVLPPRSGLIIRGDEPADVIAKAATIASALKDLIESQNLAVNVGGRRKHVEVGGWQALGTMLGTLGGVPLHAETVWTRKVCDDGVPTRTRYTALAKRFYPKSKGGGLREEITYDVDGFDWEAKVEVKTPDGHVAGSAEGMCSRTEATWATRDDFALRSMAETRAESRAYRRAIGWIVNMAGYNPTPAEEMGHTPGAEPDAPSGPVFGAPVDDARKVEVMAALRALIALDAEPTDSSLPELKEMAKKAAGSIVNATAVNDQAGYMPAIVANTILMLSQARAQRYGQAYVGTPFGGKPVGDGAAAAAAAQAAMNTGDRPAPSSVPAPPMTHQPAQDIRALREAGCVCDSPLEATSSPLTSADPTCPISGHGDPQTGD